MSYLDIVNFFTLDSVTEHPWRFFVLWALWYVGMVGRYLFLSYSLYKKHHLPFLGTTTYDADGNLHRFTNEKVNEEIRLSLWANVAISWLYAMATPFLASDFGLIYLKLDRYSFFYLPISFVALALLHDVIQYWTHRYAHEWKWYFRNVHAVHHRFQHPTPFSSWAMHPVDGILMSMVVILASFIFPLHPIVIIVYMHFSTYFNAVGHTYMEEDPTDRLPLFLRRYLGRGMMHVVHHKLVHVNYFYILNIWDKKFHTIAKTKADVESDQNDKKAS